MAQDTQRLSPNRPYMPPRALLIFDLDGTLFQVETVTFPAVRRALREAGFTPPAEEELQEFFGRPESEFRDWLQVRYPGVTQETMLAIPEWELRLIPEVGALYPGVLEALAELRGLATHLAICSNGPQSYVECVAHSHGLAPFFDLLRWRRPEDEGKPQMVRDLLAHFCRPPALVIGDRGDDVRAAHENGLRAIASRYGFGTEEELAPADASVASPAELPGVVRTLLSQAG